MKNFYLKEQRCKCGKLLLKGILFDGALEIKCKKCGTINEIGKLKLMDDASHYILIINDKGIITNASASVSQVLGYAPDEIIGQSFTLINPFVGSNKIGKKIFELDPSLSEENYFQLNTLHRSKTGKKIPVTVLFRFYDPTKKQKSLLLLVKLRNIKNNLDASSRYKNVLKFLDSSCDFYFNLGKNGVVEHMNVLAEKILGISQDDILGKNFFDFLSVQDFDEKKNEFEFFSANEQPFRIQENSIKGRGNKKVRTELYFTPQYSDVGKFKGYCVLGWIIKK